MVFPCDCSGAALEATAVSSTVPAEPWRAGVTAAVVGVILTILIGIVIGLLLRVVDLRKQL